MIFPSMMKFPLGNLVITPAALKAVVSVDDICHAVDRHVCGQWGSVSDAVRAANEAALVSGGRLLSVYKAHGIELRIMTSADRLTTTVHLPTDSASVSKTVSNG